MLEKLPEAVGHALEGARAGIERTVIRKLLAQRELPSMKIESAAFAQSAPIPIRFTSDGEGVSPPLRWGGVPASSQCVVLIVEDADSPTPQPLVHAIAVLGSGDGELSAGVLRSADHAGAGIDTGLNSYLQHAWLPPDPPPGHGAHRYVFQLFALAMGADLSRGPGRGELFDAVMEHAIAVGTLIGTYERARRDTIDQTDNMSSVADGGLAIA